MKLAVYRAFNRKATLIDWLIGIFTFSKYSHVELIFSDGTAFSASGNDKEVRFKRGINFDNGNWVVLDLFVNNEDELREYCSSLVGKKYSIFGAIFAIFRLERDVESDKYYCSEVVSYALKKEQTGRYTYIKNGYKSTPSSLYYDISKKPMLFKYLLYELKAMFSKKPIGAY